MFTLGYSGLNHALDFRKKELSGLSDREYRICQGMDAAAALLYKGEVVAAAAEERFNGEVHTCRFPLNAIQYCLQQGNISIHQLDAICHGFNFQEVNQLYQLDAFTEKYYQRVLHPDVQKKLFHEHFGCNVIEQVFTPIRHHDAHAASTYYPSDLENALIIVADGLGETDSISVYHGLHGSLTSLRHFDLFSSLGMFYSMITYHLGFEPNNDEYKVMGLAPYGDPNRFKLFFEKCVELRSSGEIYIPVFQKNKTSVEKQTYRGLRDWISQSLIPERRSDGELTQIHRDIAAGLQSILNKALWHLVTYWQAQTKTKHLCLAGGVALNCTSNGLLLASGLFDKIYVQPAAGDDGTALGAALYKYYLLDKQPYIKKAIEMPFYGPSFSDADIVEVLRGFHDKISFVELSDHDLLTKAVDMMMDGLVIAWMQGRMEFGPRALGNRSILADPRRPEMRDKINHAVKKREAFRPFAPSVKIDKAAVFFDIPEDYALPYMLFTAVVKQAYRSQLPAITHVDGSARVQTVDRSIHPLYWDLLDRFEERSGFPILLNTSFNVKGQPMVCTPEDAVLTLLATQIDTLFIGHYLVTKRDLDIFPV